jgi:hypothetical protein
MRVLLFVCLPACFAQTWLRHDFTASFRYEVKLGQNSYYLNNASGYGVGYAYRPVRWLALDIGMEQIPRPVGHSVCCEYLDNANDELFLVPFGARYVWERERIRFATGGGGAYLNHAIGHEYLPDLLTSASGWGVQGVGGANIAVGRSGRFRVGLTGRYYFARVNRYVTARIFTIGPDFTFSLR